MPPSGRTRVHDVQTAAAGVCVCVQPSSDCVRPPRGSLLPAARRCTHAPIIICKVPARAFIRVHRTVTMSYTRAQTSSVLPVYYRYYDHLRPFRNARLQRRRRRRRVRDVGGLASRRVESNFHPRTVLKKILFLSSQTAHTTFPLYAAY